MDSFLKKHFYSMKTNTFPDEIQLRFLKRFYHLLSNGYSIIDALKMFQWDDKLQQQAQRITMHLKSGLTIDRAFQKVGFHETITAFLYFSRTHGDLQFSLLKCIEMTENRIKATKRFKRVLRYPIILLLIFFMLLIVIKQFVLPSFNTLLQGHLSHSFIFKFGIVIIEVLIIFLILGFVVFMSSVLFYMFYKRLLSIEQQIKWFQRLPIVRTFITLQTSYYFSIHLRSLISTGMPLNEILKVISSQKQLQLIAHFAHILEERLLQGIQIHHTLEELPFFENELVYIFEKNTNMDELKTDLDIYTHTLQEDIQDQVIRLITYIQPVIFMFIASFIIFIYITLMWPMFQLIQTL